MPKDTLLICGPVDDHYFVWEDVIFNRDFARALFGERPVNRITGEKYVAKKLERGVVAAEFVCPSYHYHLQQAVISKDPIAYMHSVVFGE